MNLALFFEGTGQGVAGRFTNVTRLKEICVDDETQQRFLVDPLFVWCLNRAQAGTAPLQFARRNL